ncbi:2458_t:CDS:10 [Acaulospora morrowiae]|uniref:2458_t:CDS:1 n=1 Tax=Acaulospora morrowiae TaxID=94023 RepID=A0A9N8VGM0_9GLOM|nr:2458_t:CDS:10 [Acaulospora morrowiae]
MAGNTNDYTVSDSYIIQTSENDSDLELLLHYVSKLVMKGNITSPIKRSNLKTCLDIGYGGGSWMMEMATDYPDCQFYGIDLDPGTPDLVYPNNCIFQKGDYLKSLPYPENTFDLLHVRATLLWLDFESFKNLLKEAVRVTKKGGFIEFLEQDIETTNTGPILTSYIDTWREIQMSKNIDGNLMSKMETLLAEQGFGNIKINNCHIPIGKWAGFVGEFFLSAFELFVLHTASLTYESLNLRNESDCAQLVQELSAECEQYKPQANLYFGFAQKL